MLLPGRILLTAEHCRYLQREVRGLASASVLSLLASAPALPESGSQPRGSARSVLGRWHDSGIPWFPNLHQGRVRMTFLGNAGCRSERSLSRVHRSVAHGAEQSSQARRCGPREARALSWPRIILPICHIF